MSNLIMGIDPGQLSSGVCYYNGEHPTGFKDVENGRLIEKIQTAKINGIAIAMEEFKNYGMGVGKTTIDSIFWSGRFYQAYFPLEIVLIPRKTVVTNICGSARASNSNVRHALLDHYTEMYADRLGEGATPVKGTKKNQGPLYGMTNHMFSALAVAMTYYDQQQETK